jgi:hypothetical protein
VENLLAPIGRNVACGRGTLVPKQGFDFTAQKLLVELESFLAVAVEIEIRIALHVALLEKLEFLNCCLTP